MILCFLLALAVGFTYYRWQLNKLRNKNKLLEDKNRLLNEKIELEHNLNKSVLKSIKAQMNPHFFYNALNTIQAYIFTNDKTKANSYLAKFSKLTRVILEQSEKETISLGDEIESLTLYLELEKMRFKEAFEYTIEHKTDTHKDSIEFPPMLIQPYIENAIKHGLLHKDSDRTLCILFEEIKQHLVITIDDNGIGRKRSEELNKIKNDKYQSFSTQANEKRLEILNHTNDKIAVKIIDKNGANGQSLGTKVILTIPII
jgi:LytS/YehU family sensor histidine kinase